MLFNQIPEGRFSAIAASFNPAFERDCAKETVKVFTSKNTFFLV